jgi:hypothetical protein
LTSGNRARAFGAGVSMIVAGGACGSTSPYLADAPRSALRGGAGLRAADDPTVRGARLFPESLDEAHGWGVEAGGGVRAVVAGIRIVLMAGGGMVVASDRLPATPSNVVALPERLGGGFLFSIGSHLWGADSWLGRANPLFTSPLPIAQVLVGLDRAYVRSPQGVLVALNPRTGEQVGLGPMPPSPNVGRLAAMDGWRAVAIADLRGTLLTLDAGSTWRPLALPIDPSDVVAMADSIAVGGLDEGRRVQWWEVRADGQASKLPSTPAPGAPFESSAAPADPVVRAFGPRPMIAAVEDGWPLTDGTALVARDGALGRVRLSDGGLVESAADAFSLKPARCHALGASTTAKSADAPFARDALFFVCGEPRGRTVLYRWDARSARLVEIQRFENPRQVLGFGNGALAVRGPCAADLGGDDNGLVQTWCVMAPGRTWKERSYPTEQRLVVLSDARVLLLRPPRVGDLSTARITLADDSRPTEIPISFPALPAEVARAIGSGVWMEGFEERRPGVVGGWIDAAGSVIGIEIAASGEALVGEYIRDAGAPIASGRWAFGWTASRRGFETTDGGMTWTKEIPLPEPIASRHAVQERVCGPIGCTAAGWLRIGWGAAEQVTVSEPRPSNPPPRHAAPNLELDCEPLHGAPPEPAVALGKPAARSSSPAHAPTSGVFAGPTWSAPSERPPFAGRAGPTLRADDVGLSVEAGDGLEHMPRVALARVYAWGPKGGEWDQLGRWQVRWLWPWGGWPDVRSSSPAATPWTSLDAAGRALGKVPGTRTGWLLAEGDDPDHALLVARRTQGSTTADVVLLETDRPPLEVRPPGGEPFPDVEGAVRSGGHWYIATAQAPGELAATVVWRLESATAREVVRAPRAGFEARPALRLARRADGRGVGLIVDGQPDALRGTTLRWVATIDPDAGTLAIPEPLAPVDLSDRTVSLCTGDDAGWGVILPYPGTVRLHIGPHWESTLETPLARMRLSHERACVERVLGAVPAFAPSTPAALRRSPHPVDPRSHEGSRTIEVSVVSSSIRYGLRCATR